MGMDRHISIHVETSAKACMDKIRTLDTNRIGWGTACPENQTKLDWDGYLSYFDAEALISRMAGVLKSSGWAYVIDDCEEDVPECTTWYYLGDKVKNLHFVAKPKASSSKGAEYVRFTELDIQDLIAHQDEIVFLRLYLERYYKMRYDEKVTDVIKELAEAYRCEMPHDRFMLEGYLSASSPTEQEVFSPLLVCKTACKYEDHDFMPNLGWEHKGYVKFSEKEKKIFRRAALAGNGENSSSQNRLVRDVIADLTNTEPVSVADKVFVVDNDKGGEFAARITACGGIVAKKISAKSDYLVLNNRAKDFSTGKLRDFLVQTEKGNCVMLVTFDMVEDAMN